MAVILCSGCGHVAIKDAQVCADMGSQGATCDNIFTSAPIDFGKSDWDDMRFGMFCMSSDAFGDIKQEIESLCSVSGKCDYPTMQAVFSRLDRLKVRAISQGVKQ